MGKQWDHGVPGKDFWAEYFKVAKPGAMLLAFGGTRTYHRLACAIEDAGWEIRDCIMWVYGSGFPKSTNISKAIDKGLGKERKVVGGVQRSGKARNSMSGGFAGTYSETEAGCDESAKWEGWGTALKPAWEPIIMARKPFKGACYKNVMEHGTGGINIDGCRVPTEDNLNGGAYAKDGSARHDGEESWRYKREGGPGDYVQPVGRFPANLIHDGSDEVRECFPDSKGQQGDLKGHVKSRKSPNGCFGEMAPALDYEKRVEDDTSAARFFYAAKANKKDRGEGNNHPTVKPTELMRYLCRLVTPPGGTVLDPFCGSGSTGKAATLEGFDFVGMEREAEYVEIAERRVAEAAELALAT